MRSTARRCYRLQSWPLLRTGHRPPDGDRPVGGDEGPRGDCRVRDMVTAASGKISRVAAATLPNAPGPEVPCELPVVDAVFVVDVSVDRPGAHPGPLSPGTRSGRPRSAVRTSARSRSSSPVNMVGVTVADVVNVSPGPGTTGRKPDEDVQPKS